MVELTEVALVVGGGSIGGGGGQQKVLFQEARMQRL
jgi:hypothetical protein